MKVFNTNGWVQEIRNALSATKTTDIRLVHLPGEGKHTCHGVSSGFWRSGGALTRAELSDEGCRG